MNTMYNTQPASANSDAMTEISEMICAVSGLLSGVSDNYTGPEAAAIKMVGNQLDVYRQALEIVVTHIETPDILVKNLFMPAKVRRNVIHEFRNVLDSANIGDLLENFVTTSVDSAAAALRAIVQKDQDDPALYEALHWLEMANDMLSDEAVFTYSGWNNQQAA